MAGATMAGQFLFHDKISAGQFGFILVILVGIVGLLMVSSWRFWSGKEINVDEKKPFQLPVLIGVIGALIAWKSDWMLMFIALGYLVSGVLARLAYGWGRSRRHSHPSGPTAT